MADDGPPLALRRPAGAGNSGSALLKARGVRADPDDVKGVLLYGLVAAIVAGGAMAVTLSFGHELDHAWRLPLLSAGVGGTAGLILAAVVHAFTRPK